MFYPAKSLAMRIPVKESRSSVSVAGARTLLMLIKTASMIWDSFILKPHNAVLGKISGNVGFKSFTELQNAPISNLTELSLAGVMERAAEKSSQGLHDEAIRKLLQWKSSSRSLLRSFSFYNQLMGGNLPSASIPSPPSRLWEMVLFLLDNSSHPIQIFCYAPVVLHKLKSETIFVSDI